MSTMTDFPPSYEEVVKSPPIPRDQSSAAPNAPPLESIAAVPINVQEQPSQPALSNPHAQVGRFSSWDDRATKILVVNRLDMNERFEKARNHLERHLLWNVIVNHLLTVGYNFARIDAMQYWKYLFSIYNSIIDDLYAGKSIDTTWKYFEPMDNVFKYTTKRPKSTKDTDSDTIREVLPSQPMFSIVYNGIESQTEPMTTPRENGGVVTTQPRSTVHRYTPLAPSSNSIDESRCCWFCWFCNEWCDGCRDVFREGCCADNPSAYIARASDTGRTVGRNTDRTNDYISRNDVYNSTVYSIDELTSGLSKDTHSFNDDGYHDTNSHSNDNRHVFNRANECYNTGGGGRGSSYRYHDADGSGTSYSHHDSGGGNTSYSCHDTGSGDTSHSNHHSSGGTSHSNHHSSGGTSHSNHHSSGGTSNSNHHTSYSSHDTGTGGTSHSNHHTSYSCHDTGGSSASHSNHDTSTSYSCNDTGGGSTDYGCSDTGGTDYSCYDTGGGDD